jgi:hypothetical protein
VNDCFIDEDGGKAAALIDCSSRYLCRRSSSAKTPTLERSFELTDSRNYKLMILKFQIWVKIQIWP